MTGASDPRETLLQKYRMSADDPLAPALLLIERVTKQLSDAAQRATGAANAATDETYERFATEILEKVTRSQLRRATIHGVFIAVLVSAVLLWVDRVWVQSTFQQTLDADVAAGLNATPADVKFLLDELRVQPETRRNLAIIHSLENARPGFTAWVNQHGLDAYDLFVRNGNDTCPQPFYFSDGVPGCRFINPFPNTLSP